MFSPKQESLKIDFNAIYPIQIDPLISLEKEDKIDSLSLSILETGSDKPFPSSLNSKALLAHYSTPLSSIINDLEQRKKKKRHYMQRKPKKGYCPEQNRWFSANQPVVEETDTTIYIAVDDQILPFSPQEMHLYMKSQKRPFHYLPFLLFSDKLLAKRRQKESSSSPLSITPPLYLKFVSDKVGWGAYAIKDIAQNEVIGEYTGVVEKRLIGGPYAMHYPSVDGEKLDIDATYFGNETRFINHSKNANVFFEERQSPQGNLQMLFVALRPISKGVQLLADYGEKYWQGIRYEQL